jgi:hypothetical protein
LCCGCRQLSFWSCHQRSYCTRRPYVSCGLMSHFRHEGIGRALYIALRSVRALAHQYQSQQTSVPYDANTSARTEQPTLELARKTLPDRRPPTKGYKILSLARCMQSVSPTTSTAKSMRHPSTDQIDRCRRPFQIHAGIGQQRGYPRSHSILTTHSLLHYVPIH